MCCCSFCSECRQRKASRASSTAGNGRPELQTVSEVTLKKKDHAVTMSVQSSVRIDECPGQVDPQILFQQLVAATNNKYGNKKEVFRHGLCSFPSSLFETTGLLLQPNKAALADELDNHRHQTDHRKPIFSLFLMVVHSLSASLGNVEPLSAATSRTNTQMQTSFWMGTIQGHLQRT